MGGLAFAVGCKTRPRIAAIVTNCFAPATTGCGCDSEMLTPPPRRVGRDVLGCARNRAIF